GFARVELQLTWCAPRPAVSEPAPALAADGDMLLRVTLTSPALVGAAIIDASYRETRREIPGSAVRGAVGFALRELTDDADGGQATQDLLEAARGAHFGFLYPADPEATQDTASGPLPITAAVCKREQRAHGVVDTLLDRLVLLHAASAGEAERATRQAATH